MRRSTQREMRPQWRHSLMDLFLTFNSANRHPPITFNDPRYAFNGAPLNT